jgi:hypothetical protein
MKHIYAVFMLIALISCNSPSSKIIGKWYAIGSDGGSIYKMDGKKEAKMIMSIEFNRDGNAFNNLVGNITPYKWELSNDKISLTSSLSSETLEVIENRLLISAYNGMPMIFIKEGDNISEEEFAAIIKRNIDKSQYLKQIQSIDK